MIVYLELKSDQSLNVCLWAFTYPSMFLIQSNDSFFSFIPFSVPYVLYYVDINHTMKMQWIEKEESNEWNIQSTQRWEGFFMGFFVSSFFVSAFNAHFMDLISSVPLLLLNSITIEFHFNSKQESCCLWYFFVIMCI